MRLATFAEDYWELESGEARHADAPDRFSIPPRAERQDLQRGIAAKLMFAIETEDEESAIEISVERMWVVVREKIDACYIGILINQPISFELANDDTYLCKGAEIAFMAEHVIDTDTPPEDFLTELFAAPPSKTWDRPHKA